MLRVAGRCATIVLFPLLMAMQPLSGDAQSSARVHSFEVVREYPHDPRAFTQGLLYRDGYLYESTGLNGRSSLRRVRLETGEVLQQTAIDAKYFAEGLTELGGELFQLTWITQVGFVYDRATFALKRRFSYRGEGWGLTTDGAKLIMSDGTSTLRYLDPKALNEIGRLRVTDGGRPVEHLNELELVGQRILANVFLTDRIAIINTANGEVRGWLDLSTLLPRRPRAADAVLNGIAYDAEGGRLFVTGKLWPSLFELRIPALP